MCNATFPKIIQPHEKLEPIERCLQNPPLQGSYGPSTIDLRVHETIRIGDEHNAQLVVVEILTANPPVKALTQGAHVVAKIYDPLYVDDDNLYINPFMVANKSYTHEVASYEALSDLQGLKIPQYYGSYSLDIPVKSSTTITPTKRSVRLILIEQIFGTCMRDLNPDEISPSTRQHIMKLLIEYDTLIFSKKLILGDLHPRNIMLTNDSIILVDFGDTLFPSTDTFAEDSFEILPTTSISPILRWHKVNTSTRRNYDFDGWIDWKWQPWLEAEFKHTAASITPELRELFIPARALEAESESD